MNVLLLAAAVLAPSMGAYEATWESIDSRPNPQWFEDAKFGI
ncbi:MAG: alpha-L-fucosidase, partial [Candidatus Hydrogenedentes bacterium]|nr:alpha-L-fucosidase [Candidatus Hydrogenedentota bacterium]